MFVLKIHRKTAIIMLFVVFSLLSIKVYPQFIENKGQVLDLAENFHPEVKYLYSAGNNTMFFEDQRVVCVFSKQDKFDYTPYEGNQRAKDSIYKTLGKEIQRIDIEFVGAATGSELISGEKEAAYLNYFLNKRENIRNVGMFKSVCYKNIYPNIDIVFKQYKTGVKYDVVLHPGANLEDVKIRYNGASSVDLEGDVVKIKTKFYEFSEDIPIAFINDNNKQIAEVHYNVANDVISFLCKYSASDKLTIDPVIEWMTYYETASSSGLIDYDHNVADNDGNLFISGYCNNTANDYPTVNPGGSAYVQAYTSNDLYIAKFDPNRALVWGTYFGGSNSAMDWALGTEVMAIGGDVLHIVGDDLASNGPFLNGGGFYYNPGSEKPYYARFNKNTGVLLHCTNLPGHTSSHPSIAISPSGQVGIILSTYDWGIIAGHKVTRTGAYNQATNGGFTDLFLMLLNTSYTQIWGTFLGGPGTQENGHIAFDASNNIFFSAEVQWLSGSTAATEHLVNPGGGAYYQTTYNGEDIMIGKFTSTGSLYWNTMYSGNGNDGLDDEMGNGTKVIVNPSNEVLVIGGTSSTDLPLMTLAGAYNATCPANVNNGGSYDDFASFILKFSNTGVRQWATYWGENIDTCYALLYDGKFTSCDKFIVAARAIYTPISYPGYYNKASGGQSFLMQFNNNYAAEWSSYIGDKTGVPQLAYSPFGNRLFVTTYTSSQTETTVNPGGGAYYDGVFAGPYYGSYSIWQFNIATTPTFSTMGPYCVGETPGTLPTTSANGIPGTWSPATISTASAGTVTYTFIPSASCSSNTTMSITINPSPTPTFTALGPYCQGATPGSLSGTSTNGITGSWSPASISTASAGTTTYNFTPTGGQCATTASMPVTVTANVSPTFTALGPYCQGAGAGTLQGTSLNGVTGSWSPATISTASAGTTTYNFTPTGGQCATTASMPVTVTANVTPTFTALGPYCQGAGAGTLQGTSLNGVTGSWSPASISTASAGTTTYNFTPTGGQCATTTTLDVAVTSSVTAVLSGGTTPICDKTSPGTFTVTATGGSGAYVYQWYNAQGAISGATNSTYTPGIMVTSNGFYCSVSSSPCGWINSDTAIVIVTPQVGNPTPITISAGTDPSCQLANGTTTTTYATTATHNNGFVWSLSNSLAGTIDPATGVMTWADGFYGNVNIQVYALGCGIPSSTITHPVNVNQSPTAEAGTHVTYTGIPVPLGNLSSGPGTFSWSPTAGLNDPAISQPLASPLTTTTYTLTVNNNGCIATDTVTVTFGGLGHTISGKTVYAGKAFAGSPVPNNPTYNPVIYTIDRTIVILKNFPSNDEVARDTSDANGVYQFTNIMDGTYTLAYDKYTADTMISCNNVNAIDVAAIKYFIGSDTLQDPSYCFSSIYKKAANVDNNANINAVDVAKLKSKIGSPFDPAKNFPKGNWVALNKQITLAGADLNVNLETIGYGDYNASSSKYWDSVNTWSGAKSLPEEFIQTSDESIIVTDPSYIEIPLKVNTKVNDFSALGLELAYSNSEYKLVSARMSATNEKGTVKINPLLEEIIANDNDLLVTDDQGTIRVVYATTNHFDVAPNDEMIVLGFRPLKDLQQGEIEFALSGTGVIGNQFGEENDDAYLLMPKVFVQGDGLDAGFDFSGYPNPFNGEATITYNIPENGMVTLNVYNAIGELVTKLVNENQESGKHAVVFSQKDLAAGMYTFKLEFSGINKSKNLILKMIH